VTSARPSSYTTTNDAAAVTASALGHAGRPGKTAATTTTTTTNNNDNDNNNDNNTGNNSNKEEKQEEEEEEEGQLSRIVTIAPTLLCDYKPRRIRAVCK